jgi:hypothetical protein
MYIKIRDLFDSSENGFYKYKGEFALQVGNKLIQIDQQIDLKQLNLENVFKDDGTLHLIPVDRVYHLNGSSSSV